MSAIRRARRLKRFLQAVRWHRSIGSGSFDPGTDIRCAVAASVNSHHWAAAVRDDADDEEEETCR
jgi:hypothetical protein